MTPKPKAKPVKEGVWTPGVSPKTTIYLQKGKKEIFRLRRLLSSWSSQSPSIRKFYLHNIKWSLTLLELFDLRSSFIRMSGLTSLIPVDRAFRPVIAAEDPASWPFRVDRGVAPSGRRRTQLPRPARICLFRSSFSSATWNFLWQLFSFCQKFIYSTKEWVLVGAQNL